jgi:hypothetical protein
MNNMTPFSKTFTVTVIHNSEDGMWIAECDEIGMVTEAETYESLTWRVWEIAPEVAVANGFNVTEETMRLNFQHTETAA